MYRIRCQLRVNMYYTYAHYTPEGRLFYIGKGSDVRRAHSLKGRNAYWHRVVAKYGKPEVQILAEWNTNQEALEHEIILISCFRKMGYALCNITNGGEGSLGAVPWNKGKPWSDEIKAKCGAANKGNKHWLGRKHTDDTIRKQKLAKTVYRYIGTNIKSGELLTFVGRNALAEAGFTSTHVYRCAKGKAKSHKGFTWVKEPIGATQWH